jgi:hypothetical protein
LVFGKAKCQKVIFLRFGGGERQMPDAEEIEGEWEMGSWRWGDLGRGRGVEGGIGNVECGIKKWGEGGDLEDARCRWPDTGYQGPDAGCWMPGK